MSSISETKPVNQYQPPETLEEFMLTSTKAIDAFVSGHTDSCGEDMVLGLAEAITSSPTPEDKIRMFDMWADQVRESYKKYRC